MRRVLSAMALGIVLLAFVAAPVVAAPTKVTSGPPDVADEFPAGAVCGFTLRLEGWNSEHVTEGEDGDGNPRIVVTGGGITRITNVDSSASVIRRTQGRVVITDFADEETLSFAGRQLLYFFPGDVGPTGTDGGLFLMTGRVHEVLDFESFLITSFRYAGRYEDLCALLDLRRFPPTTPRPPSGAEVSRG